MTENEGNNGSAVKLTVSVRDAHGDIIEERCKDDDLYLMNWGVLIATMLQTGINTGAGNPFRGFDLSGNSFFCGTSWASFGNPTGSTAFNTCSADNKGRVMFGVSGVAPTLNDYRNGNNMLSVSPNAPTIINDGNVMKIIFTATAAVENEITLSECAYYVILPTAGEKTAILTRDTFEPVTVPAGGSITVSFEYWLNGVPTPEA